MEQINSRLIHCITITMIQFLFDVFFAWQLTHAPMGFEPLDLTQHFIAYSILFLDTF